MYVHVYLHSPCVKKVPFLASETEMLYIYKHDWMNLSDFMSQQEDTTHLPGTLLPAAPWSAFLPVTRLVGAPRVTMLDSQVVASWNDNRLLALSDTCRLVVYFHPEFIADSCWFYSEIVVDHNGILPIKPGVDSNETWLHTEWHL